MLNAVLRFTSWFEARLEGAFVRLGKSVSRSPWTYVAGSLIFVLVCSGGLSFTTVESKGESLWVPQDSVPMQNRRRVEDVPAFGLPPREETVLLFADDPGTAPGVLTVANVRRLFDLWDTARAVVSADGDTFEDVCERYLLFNGSEGECVILNTPLAVWGGDRDAFEADVGGDQAVLLERLSAPSDANDPLSTYGTPVYDSGGTLLESAAAVGLNFHLRATPEDPSLAWESEYVRQFKVLRAESGGELEFLSWRSIDDELERATQGDVPLFAGALLAMIAFLALTSGSYSEGRLRPRVGLAVIGVGCVVLGVITSYGIGSALGVPFTALNGILPFVLLGLGADDVYVMSGAFDREPESLPTGDRIANSMRHAAMSISVTSLTNAVAFAAGASSEIPAVRYFCVYASVAVLAIFALFLTLFVASMAISDRRRLRKAEAAAAAKGGEEESGAVVPVAAAGAGAGGAKKLEAGSSSATVGQAGAGGVYDEDDDDDDDESHEQPAGPLSLWCRNRYAAFLLRPRVKVAVLLLFAAMLAAGVFFATQLEMEFDLEDATPDDSYARSYLKRQRAAFAGRLVLLGLYFQALDFPAPRTQALMLEYVDDILDTPFVDRPGRCFLGSYQEWYSSRAPYNASLDADGYLDDAALYRSGLDEFLSGDGFAFAGDLQREADGEVTDARCFVLAQDPEDAEDKRDSVLSTERVSDASPLNDGDGRAFALMSRYIFWTQFLSMRSDMVINLTLVGVGIVAICSVLLVHPTAVLLLLLVVAAIDAQLLGWIVLSGLFLNSVTAIQLTMAGGLIVDYVAHVARGFIAARRGTRDERAALSLEHYGSAVILGATTTLMGVAPTALAESEIFRSFSRVFTGIVLLGAAHGLILMPVLLSLFGPLLEREKHRPARPGPDAAEKGVELGAASGNGAAGEGAEVEEAK